jgi:branched-chain amino acid transport system permease protein
LTAAERIGHFVRQHRTGLAVLGLSSILLLTPLVVSNPYNLDILNLIGLYTIVVLGLNLFIGFAGQISLGHAAFFGLGAYGSALLTTNLGFPPWGAMALVAFLMAVVALIIGIPTLKLSGHYLAMATLGFNIVVYEVFIQWDNVTGGPSGFPGIPPLKVFGHPIEGEVRFYYLVWALAMLALMLCLNLVRSGVGRGLSAVAQDETAAAALGVDVKRSKVAVFVLSAVFASVAGSLYAHYRSFISPDTFSIFASLELVIMTVVGGLGSVWGTLFGVGFIVPLPHMLEFFDNYKDIAHGVILVVILLFLPQGFVIGVVEAFRMRLARWRRTSAGASAGSETGG